MKNDQDKIWQAPLVRGYEDSYLKLTKNRSIFFSENFTDNVAADLTALLLYYDNQDHEAPIYLYINSNGGNVSALNSIYDIMQIIKAPVKTILLGKCYSAGAILLASGFPGERYALKSSNIMIHGVQFVYPITDDMKNNQNYLDIIEEINDLLLKMLSKHTGQSISKLKVDTAREYWMNAQEALDYGIIDHII